MTPKQGISRPVIAVVVIVIIVIAGLGIYFATAPSSTTTTTSSTTPSTSTTTTTLPTSTTTTLTTTSSSSSVSALQPPNPNQLVDDLAAGFPEASSTPDGLDPAFGFATHDEPVFNNVYQQLVETNGSNFQQIVPVIASSWQVSSNGETYTFSIRSGVWFSNMDPVNAYTVWFSFVREIYLNSPSGVAPSNFEELTENLSANVPDAAFPWGLRNAVASLGGQFSDAAGPSQADVNVFVSVMNSMLSHFDPTNSTQLKIMSYPDQAYVATDNSTFVTNLMNPYSLFPQDIAIWWGAVVDPVWVDSNGGVQNNTVNNTFNDNGGPGTGPYEISSVGPSFIPVVLKANPHYWAANVSGLASILQPPHINTIIIQYGASTNSQIQDFAANKAQITYAAPSSFSQLYDAYNYKSAYTFNDLFDSLGYATAFWYLSMNTQRYPTNITDFRLAIVHAVNTTEQLDTDYVNSINGQIIGENYLGPMVPQNGAYYDPGNLPQYQANYTLAAQEIAAAGVQGNFYVTLPNGTQLGCTSCAALPPIQLVYVTPINPQLQVQLQEIQANLGLIGVNVAITGLTSTIESSITGSPTTTPLMLIENWFPDWNDPVFQLLDPAATTSSFLQAWFNNATVNQIMTSLPFVTNQTLQLQGVAKVYQMLYQQAPYAWLPNPVVYVFTQPYLHGFQWNAFAGYWYNTLYYST